MSLSRHSAKLRRYDTFTKLEELVTCALCLELLENPKVFPCLHSYCYECIVKLAKRDCGLECPECRAPVEIGTPPDFSKLPTNFFANNVLATLSLRVDDEGPALLCDNCQKEDETAHVEKCCKDCRQFLCALCAEFHQQSVDTKDHVLLSKDELKGNQPAENASQIKCSKHNEVCDKYYCDTCQEAICLSCTILDHKQHKFVSVEESASKAKEEVQNLVEDVKKRMEKISTGIEAMKTKSEDITRRNETCKSQIERFFTQLYAEIDAQKQCVLAVAECTSEYQKNNVDGLKKVLERSLSACQNGVDFAEHTLENGDDVQFLKLKSTVTMHLGTLTPVQDKITSDVGHPVRFLQHGSSDDQLFKRVISRLYSVDEVAVCAEKCQAKLSDPVVKVGQKSVIVITCLDEEDRLISSGVGKDLIEPTITGVLVRDVEIKGKKDGRYVVSFVPDQLGTLQFHAKINGCVSPGCSLKADVQWELSYAHGSGYLRADRQLYLNCMSGEGDVGTYSFRLGDTPMTTGAHHWKVKVGHEIQDANECSEERATFEVGVIEVNDEYSEASIKNGTTKKWVYSGSSGTAGSVSLYLDMEKKSLKILPGGKILVAKSKFSFRRKTLHVKADSVLPFLSVNCPHCSLTIRKIHP